MDEVKSGTKLRGEFVVECYRWHDEHGKRFCDARGRFERQLIWVEKTHNIWTNQGLNSLLNIMLHATTQITTWYCILFENDFTPDGDETYAVPGYTESTAYDEATRPEYVEAESTAKSTTNSANKAAFTINATKTMYGAALVGGGSAASTKGNTAGGGTLAVAGRFVASRAVIDNDVINLTYTVTSADDAV